MGPNPVWLASFQEEEKRPRLRYTERTPCDDGRRDWSEASQAKESQKLPATPEAKSKAWKDSPIAPSEREWPWFQISCLKNWRGINVCLKSPSLLYFVTAILENQYMISTYISRGRGSERASRQGKPVIRDVRMRQGCTCFCVSRNKKACYCVGWSGSCQFIQAIPISAYFLSIKANRLLFIFEISQFEC